MKVLNLALIALLALAFAACGDDKGSDTGEADTAVEVSDTQDSGEEVEAGDSGEEADTAAADAGSPGLDRGTPGHSSSFLGCDNRALQLLGPLDIGEESRKPLLLARSCGRLS